MSIGITNLSAFVIGAILIVLLPGPNSLYVMSVASRSGVKQAYRGAFGIFLGDSILMAASAMGIASLLKAVPTAFLLVKFSGAIYLAWLGAAMLRAARRAWRDRVADTSAQLSAPADRDAQEPTATAKREAQESAATVKRDARDSAASANGKAILARPADSHSFRTALIISIMNPKAILFFLSFFIQFVDVHQAHPGVAYLVEAAIVQTCSALYLTALIFGGAYLAEQFRRRRGLAAVGTGLVGSLFLGFSVKLASSTLQ